MTAPTRAGALPGFPYVAQGRRRRSPDSYLPSASPFPVDSPRWRRSGERGPPRGSEPRPVDSRSGGEPREGWGPTQRSQRTSTGPDAFPSPSRTNGRSVQAKKRDLNSGTVVPGDRGLESQHVGNFGVIEGPSPWSKPETSVWRGPGFSLGRREVPLLGVKRIENLHSQFMGPVPQELLIYVYYISSRTA